MTVDRAWRIGAGVLLCAMLAAFARELQAWLGPPAMLTALLAGIVVRAVLPNVCQALSFGISFSAQTLLRIGVALLGARVLTGDLLALGTSSIGVVLVSVVATLAGGIAFGRRFGLPFDIGRIAATSVTICGASAALAASAVMPNRPGLVRDTALVIVIVSLLSTAVMILYPLALGASGLAETQIALVIGAAVHDVAQVVGAGFAVSNDVGVQAVTVKMLRVACLVPVVLWLASTSQSPAADGKRPRVRLPWFLWVFVLLAAASSFGLVSADLRGVLGAGSGLLLLTSVAALGLATEARALGQAPRALVMSLFVQTIWQLTVVVSLVVAAGFALKWM